MSSATQCLLLSCVWYSDYRDLHVAGRKCAVLLIMKPSRNGSSIPGSSIRFIRTLYYIVASETTVVRHFI